MTLQVDFWQLVGLLTGFIAFCGAGGALLLRILGKSLDERFAAQEAARAAAQAQLADRLTSMEQVNRDETIQWQRVERELLELKAELPHRYVMRDDYIRGQSIVEAKLDGLADKIEKAQLRAVIAGGSP
jgi:hypothetical protein